MTVETLAAAKTIQCENTAATWNKKMKREQSGKEHRSRGRRVWPSQVLLSDACVDFSKESYRSSLHEQSSVEDVLWTSFSSTRLRTRKNQGICRWITSSFLHLRGRKRNHSTTAAQTLHLSQRKRRKHSDVKEVIQHVNSLGVRLQISEAGAIHGHVTHAFLFGWLQVRDSNEALLMVWLTI